MSSPATPLSFALALAEKRIAVFPLRPNEKLPYSKLAISGGWPDVSTTVPQQIEAWDKQFPGCNWGVDCGKSGLFVIDVDVKDGKDGGATLAQLEAAHGKLPCTFTVQTPTGGFHRYFKGSGKTTAGTLGVGIDTRSVGGYVVSPGSIIDDKAYLPLSKGFTLAEAPSRIVAAAGETKERTPDHQTPACELDLEHNIERATRYLQLDAPEAVQGDSGDHTTFAVACRVRDLGVAENTCVQLLLEHWNVPKALPPWSPEDLAKKVRNAYRYAQEKAGHDTPDAMFEAEPGTPVAQAPARVKSYNSSALREFCMKVESFQKISLPPREKILDPFVLAQAIILITAERGIGKTTFLIHMLASITCGAHFGPWATITPAPCLYLDAELVPQDLQSRLEGLPNERKAPFFVLSDAVLVENGLPKSNICSPSWRAAMKELLLGLGVKVWALDNLSSATVGASDENDSKDWREINAWLLDLRYAGITSVLVHHTNKAGTQRGTHSREDNIDFSILLKRPAGYKLTDGASFDVVFTKARLPLCDLAKISDVSMRLDAAGDWQTNRPKQNTRKEVLAMVADGLRNKEICARTGLKAPNVSNHLKKLKTEGFIDADGRLTRKGRGILDDPFTDESLFTAE